MKIAVLIEENYQVLEAWYPYLRLREEGINTVFLGMEKKHYNSKDGYPALVDATILHVEPSSFDGVVIPGGYAPDLMRRHKEMVFFVRTMFESSKLVAAICHAGWLLISAGILKGRKATCFFAIKDDIINAGAEYVDREVVVDGNLITSRNPFDLPAFCKEIITFLKEKT
ncbi:MAG: type 1 glutamine amidotransferase domain-containing protein [Candidatus Aminicenantales bacterium]